MIKQIIWGTGIVCSVEFAYVAGKKLGIIPSKEVVEEVIIRRQKKAQENNPIIENNNNEEGQGWISYILWGDQKREIVVATQVVPPKENHSIIDFFFNKTVDKQTSTSVPIKQEVFTNNNTIVTNAGNKVTAITDYLIDSMLNLVAPYWEIIELIIAFNLAIFILTIIAADLYILLRFLLFVKKIISLAKKLFTSTHE